MSMSKFASDIMRQKYSHKNKEGEVESWENIAYRVSKKVLQSVHAPASQIEATRKMIAERKFLPGGRYLAATGRLYHQVNNCFLFRAEDSREGWSDMMQKATLSLMTGGGIGCDYSDVREKGRLIRKTGGEATGPIALMQMVNESGRYIMQGGSRRSAIWAGLRWDHPDIQEFIRLKDWSPEVKAMKERDFNFPAAMDMTNISVLLNDEFFEAYNDDKHEQHTLSQSVYWSTVCHMLETGEPGLSIDTGKNSRETLRNACTEVTSADDSDVCNLGSVNMARIESLEEMALVVELGTAFLLAGTVYSDIPFAGVDKVRNKNRRLGLGLMGLHEWLLIHGKKYGADEELGKYLEIYARSGTLVRPYAKKWELSNPIKTRAIAPNGTIGIVAETTTGVEPIFCAAYKRRYLKGQVWNFQYVVDPTAKRLLDSGVPLELIEDAYDLANDVERRVSFQTWVQQYVDHSISSTINLPRWGSELNNESRVRDFGNMLIRYLPKLRGITVYPDGARAGQPLNPVSLQEALKQEGHVFEESGTTVCDITKGGVCG
ncbi:Vitamin B12-dependent ribonucleoside-diphosphate reductase [uncultured archaeon]|nr:Vitamin B12-dependent ribonucleoside-diphosphate reductase [uncultured archaeon]